MRTNDKVDLIQDHDRIIISKQKKKHKTLEERLEEFRNLSDEEKGNVESYDWGEDFGKEKFD